MSIVVSNGQKRRKPADRRFVDSASTNILAHYNKITGIESPSPRIITLSGIASGENMYSVEERFECLEMLRKECDGKYMYHVNCGGKVFINDFNEEGRVREIISHELVHHVRNTTGASNESDYSGSAENTNSKAIWSLEEGCATFIQGALAAAKDNSPKGIVKSVFELINPYETAILPVMFTLIGNYAKSSPYEKEMSNEKLSTIIDLFRDSSIERTDVLRKSVYLAGTNFATAIFTANDFDLERTERKLLTYTYRELKEELMSAARKPELAKTISNVLRQP